MRSLWQRALMLMLALLLFASAIPPLTVGAAEGGEDPLRTQGVLSPLEEKLYTEMMAEATVIDIKGLCSSREELEEAMHYLRYSTPELFHTADGYSIRSTDGVPTAVLPSYTVTGEALETARARYLLALDEICEGVDPSWSDYEICLYLHDYLCTHFAYDTTLSIYDAYTFLTEGTGVCQSYTLTYTALLSRFDIPVSYATGRDGAVAHIWNTVTLDGEVYHIDATWGDPLMNGKDTFGTATHDNFLKSDLAIDATGHESRENYGGVMADDPTYDTGVLSTVKAPFAFLNGDAYGIADGKLYRFSDDLSEATLVYTVTENWTSFGSTLRVKPAAVAAYNGMLYVTTPHTILALDPVSWTAEELLTVEGRYLFGLYADGNTLHYGVDTDIYSTGIEPMTYTLPSAVPPCTGEHDMEEYATVPSTCKTEGARYLRCTVCGAKESEPLPKPDHKFAVTVIPPSYEAGGYTEHRCEVCNTVEKTDPTDPLAPPSVDDYLAAVSAAEAAVSAADTVAAVAAARAMEPYLDAAAIAEAKARLDARVLAYDARAEEINAGMAQTLYAALFSDGDLLTPVPTLLAILALVLRRLLGV